MKAIPQYFVNGFFINKSWICISLPKFHARNLAVKITGLNCSQLVILFVKNHKKSSEF
jgi:hypothetical protein